MYIENGTHPEMTDGGIMHYCLPKFSKGLILKQAEKSKICPVQPNWKNASSTTGALTECAG